jgi:hypothetical protein
MTSTISKKLVGITPVSYTYHNPDVGLQDDSVLSYLVWDDGSYICTEFLRSKDYPLPPALVSASQTLRLRALEALSVGR